MKIIKLFISNFKELPLAKIVTYILVYFIWGMIMNWIGETLEIARFYNWWQVITCYVLYMIPVSILLRKFSLFDQYAYGLLAMGICEFLGYALHTSYVYPDNILIQYFGPYTFALIMTLFFALYFPLGNMTVDYLYKSIFKNHKKV